MDTGSPPPDAASPRSSLLLRLVQFACWLVPLLFFAASGIAKVVAPEGELPAVLRGKLSAASYPSLLRLLGAFEIALASLLLVPGTRLAGRVLAALTLAVFCGLVALSFDDPDFIRNCGCFGGLSKAEPGSLFASPYAILARDLGLIGLLLMGLGSHAESWTRLTRRFARAVLVAALLTFGTLYLAESTVHAKLHRAFLATEAGRALAHRVGWTMPDFPLLDRTGKPTRSRDVLKGGETVLVFSPECPHCRREGPAWPSYDQELALRGERLVLLGAGKSEKLAAFLAEIGWAGQEFYEVPDGNDLLRLGVFDVPHYFQLDADRRIVRQKGASDTGGFIEAARRLNEFSPELARELSQPLARLFFGESVRLQPPNLRLDGLLSARVGEQERAQGLLIVARPDQQSAINAELALGLDSWHVLCGLLPLAWDVGVLGPARINHLLSAVEKKELSEALRIAEDRARTDPKDSLQWAALAQILQRASLVVRDIEK
ncbi:MAG: MauE/DoxX family redox-associated membrane protein [Planctomycetota bacterium]